MAVDVIDLFEAIPIASIRSPNLGGKREGSGRMTREQSAKVASTINDEGGVDYAVARARKEEWLAKTVEFDYRIKQGEYVSREIVCRVCSTAFSSIAQSLRSMPDALERREGVSPEIADRISIYIDEVMNTLSQDFEKLAGVE